MVELAIVGLFIVGVVVWGVYKEVVAPKIEKAMEPDPKWDQKTTERFNHLWGIIVLLVIMLLLFAGRGC